MSSVWAVNASPLISLARVGQLALLEAPERELRVPDAVAREVLAGPATDPARQALEAGFGGTPTSATIDLRVVEWGLGAGETSVLSYAIATGPSAPSLRRWPSRSRLSRS